MGERTTRVWTKVSRDADAFLTRYQVTLVLVSGAAPGTEYDVAAARMTIGRGEAADISIQDPALQPVHLVLEVDDKAVSATATEGLNFGLNGAPHSEAELSHGDLLAIGGQVFELHLDELDPPTRIMRHPSE